jgi:hypothetical protein
MAPEGQFQRNQLCESYKWASLSARWERNVMDGQNKKIQQLVEDLGADPIEVREAASHELGRRIKADSGGETVAAINKLTAGVVDPEVKLRVALLNDIQDEKEKLERKRKRLKKIQGQIQKWEEYQENADPGTDEGRWVVEHTDDIEMHLFRLKQRADAVEGSIKEEEDRLKRKPGG